MELSSFFERALRASFVDLGERDEPATRYLADMLARFARTENLWPRGIVVERLTTVADMLMEIQGSWQMDAGTFRPEREISVRQHIGDFTLFMTGIFRERVEQAASVSLYVDQGKRAYRFVSDCARSYVTRSGPPPFRRLSERFEAFSRALEYTRRVHFYDQPSHGFFRLRLPG